MEEGRRKGGREEAREWKEKMACSEPMRRNLYSLSSLTGLVGTHRDCESSV